MSAFFDSEIIKEELGVINKLQEEVLIIAKKYKFSRPALLIGFLLSDRIYSLTYQLTTLHTIHDLITRPIFIFIVLSIMSILYWSLTKRSKLDYA